jgi:hypothetical protein
VNRRSNLPNTKPTFHNGLIVNYPEYWNPQAFQKAMTGDNFDKKQYW